jgi:hypothetical protein
MVLWLREIANLAVTDKDKVEERAARYDLGKMLLNGTLIFLRNGCAYAYLVCQYFYGSMTIGDFTLYFSAITSLGTFLGKLSQGYSDFMEADHYVTDFPTPAVAGKKGCIVIPHLGASTEESEDNCAVMAVQEMMDYLENGNIKNSVNYPACDMGVCTKAGRVAIFHKNIANMITKFTAEFGEKGINISDMTNKSRGEVAYTMMDVEEAPTAEIIEALEKIPGVFRARIVKG